MIYLLDTCIISKLRKIGKYSDRKLEEWVMKNDESSFCLSILSIGEIQSGISRLNLQKKDEKHKRFILENWLSNELIPQFKHRILNVDQIVSITWGEIIGRCHQQGFTIPAIDGLIAATALVHNLILVTENVKDFLLTGVRLYNPWD